MSHELDKAGVRNKLEPRTEPYWGPPLSTGRHVGLRKINAASASWVARMRVDDMGDQVQGRDLIQHTGHSRMAYSRWSAAPWASSA